jgi:ABC-type uncharacterized transport system YnjBCD substrate-binding protein
MNEAKFAEFAEAYRAGLTEAVEMFPHEYVYKVELVPQVAEKMLAAIKKNPKSVTYTNSPGFKKACNKLGIKYTVKSIMEYLEVK